MRKCLAFTFCAGVIGATCLSGQETQRFTFDLAGGFTEPVGGAGNHLDLDGIFRAERATARLQFDGHQFRDVEQSRISGGDVHVFSATLDRSLI